MKLTELEPRWLHPDVFMFRSPTGTGDWLTCKRIVMPMRDQHKLIYEDNPDLKGQCVVMSNPDQAWKFEGNDFESMTVTPSIDASSSGNWHGFITKGEIR